MQVAPPSSPARSDNLSAPNRSTWDSERIFRTAFWVIILLLVAAATWANLDLTGHRAFLFMDEMIPFDNIKRICTAPNSESFWWAICDGGDHRYGRIFYNLTALVAWLPYQLGGDHALIIAIRSTQVALTLTAIVLLCTSLLRAWPARVLALLAIATLPFTDYYLSQPKPEPVQLLAYAMFIHFALRRQFAFGWHWVFLGLAFGAKISAAPFCAAAAMLGAAHLWLYFPGWKRTLSDGVLAGVGFLAGWIIAIPMLAVPNREHFDAYLQWTFKSTGHGSDDSRITILDWLKSCLSGGEVVRGAYPSWLGILLLTAGVLMLVLALITLRRQRAPIRCFFENHTGWLMLGLATALTLPIMLAVKRLWGLYLFPGQVFAIVALAGIAEQWMSVSELPRWMTIARRAALCTLAGLTLVTCLFSGKRALHEYARLAHRTSDPVYLQNLAVFESGLGILAPLVRETAQDGAPLDVVYDPFLFLPDSQPDLSIRVFWGADVGWARNPAVVVLGRTWHLSYFLGEKPLPPPTAANYHQLATAVEQFKNQVEIDPAASTTKPYQLVRWLGEDAAVVMRQDIAARWHKMMGPTHPAFPPK